MHRAPEVNGRERGEGWRVGGFTWMVLPRVGGGDLSSFLLQMEKSEGWLQFMFECFEANQGGGRKKNES